MGKHTTYQEDYPTFGADVVSDTYRAGRDSARVHRQQSHVPFFWEAESDSDLGHPRGGAAGYGQAAHPHQVRQRAGSWGLSAEPAVEAAAPRGQLRSRQRGLQQTGWS